MGGERHPLPSMPFQAPSFAGSTHSQPLQLEVMQLFFDLWSSVEQCPSGHSVESLVQTVLRGLHMHIKP